MKTQILCPGPSLCRRRVLKDAALTIGVNRAAMCVTCDVWACGDAPCQQAAIHLVGGNPLLFTAAASAAQIRDHGIPWRGRVKEFESIDRDRIATQWDTFTATAALVYAADQGATEVVVIGADWSGEADFDGVLAGGNRSEERWKLERGIWNRMVQLLNVKVTRI